MKKDSIHTAFHALCSCVETLQIELSAAHSQTAQFIGARLQLSKALYEFIAELDRIKNPKERLGSYFLERSLQMIRESRSILESAYSSFPHYS